MSKSCVAVCLLAVGSGLPEHVGAAESIVRSVHVRGEGTVSAPPDMATINLGVTSAARDATEALQKNNADMESLMAALAKHGLANKDIQTSQFNVSPNYQQRSADDRTPTIAGYHVSNQVRVVVRNLPNLGKVLDGVVTAGSNTVSGVQFDIDDQRGLLDQARNRAWQDARHRAALYAAAAGATLGPVISVDESIGGGPEPIMLRGMSEMAARSVPVAAGEQSVHVSIDVRFELLVKE